MKTLPADRDNWLLKPLFSFAGGGIIFAPTDEQIAAIPAAERANYILQERDRVHAGRSRRRTARRKRKSGS